MARSSGTYTAPSNNFNPAVQGETLDPDDWNATLDDIETALTESVYTSGLGSTDNALLRTDGTDTKKAQGTGITVTDQDHMSGVATVTLDTYTSATLPTGVAGMVGYISDGSGGGTLVVKNASSWVELGGASPVYVATRTALKALDTSINTVAYLTEAGRAGMFVFRSGDYSTEVAADTQEGIYIAATDTASSSGAWVRVVQDGKYSATWFGSVSTDNIQAAIDLVNTLGGGEVLLPAGSISLAASSLGETYYNDGVAVASSTGCLVLRDNVYLRGAGVGVTTLAPTSPTLTAVYVAAYEDAGISDLAIDASWSSTGAGHGIFNLYKTNVTNASFSNLYFERLYIANVGSYAIGLNNGELYNVHIEDLRTYNTGGDGIDLKNRATAEIAQGVFLSEIYIDTFGQRLDAQAGVDVRGVASLSNIHVINVGRSGVAQYGVRFRVRDSGSSEDWGRRSNLTNFYVKCNGDAGAVGVAVGCPDVQISSGTVEGAPNNGMEITGNANGQSDRVSIFGVVVRDAQTYGFRITSDVDNAALVACHAFTAATAGFRDEGTNTSFVGCSAPSSTAALSSSTAADGNQLLAANKFETNWINQDAASNIAYLEAKGGDTNIGIDLVPKGSGDVLAGGASVYRAGGTDVALADGGTGSSTARGAAANLTTWHVIGSSAVAVAHTGDTAETTLATITIPANALGANGLVRVTATFSNTNSGNNKTFRVRYGGTQYTVAVATTTQGFCGQTYIANRNSTSSQIGGLAVAGGWNLGSAAPPTSSVDTTASSDITITGQLANSGDTVTLESYIVELFYKA